MLLWIEYNMVRLKNKIRICGRCDRVYWSFVMCDACRSCGFGGSYVAVNTFSSWRKSIRRLVWDSTILKLITCVVLTMLIILITNEIKKIFISNTVLPVVCIEKPIEKDKNINVIYSCNELGGGGGYARRN